MTTPDRQPASPGKRSPPRGARARRPRRIGSWMLAGVFLIAIGASVLLVNVLAHRVNQRFDITALESHRLSERTQGLLDSLEGEYRLVLAGPWSAPPRVQQRQALPEPRAIRRALDALKEVDLASGRFSIARLDTASRSGQQRFNEELDRLVERDADAIARIERSLDESVDEAEGIADDLDGVAEALRAESSGLVDRDPMVRALRQLSGEASAIASRLRQRSAEVVEQAEERIGGVPVRALDRGLLAARSMMGDADTQLTRVREGIESTGAAPGAPEDLAEALASIGRRVGMLRDVSAIRRDELERLEPPASVRVARTLLTGNAALLVGPPGADGPGIVAIGFDALFPSAAARATEGGALPDVGREAEDALANALSAMIRPETPIVVVVHAESQRWVMESSAIASLRDRLAMRRIDLLEWATVVDDHPPNPRALRRGAERPVVYVAIGTSSVRARGVSEQLNGPARAKALGEAIDRIIERGDPLLLAAAPSWPAAAYDGADPTTAFLHGFGLRADSGRTVVSRTATAGGPLLEFAHRIMPERGEHPIQRSIRGLPVEVRWPIAFEPAPEMPAGVLSLERTPLLRIEDEDAWAEKEWLAGWQAAQRQQADSLQGPGLPTPTPGLDDTSGPWTVAWAVRRRVQGSGGAQRLVVVGANRWFVDARAEAGRVQGGRFVADNPGNRPLLESSIYWLAGQDEMVAASATARPVSRVRELSGSARAAIGWGLLAGLPLIVLLTGLVYRLKAG